MQCPVCDVTLSISSREGVEIDFCPQCRGVWLDRGELDKVIERARPDGRYDDRGDDRYDDRPRREERPRPDGRYDDRDERPRYDRSQERSYDRPPPRKKKKGFDFLEDIFDLG